jgi:hypothetical protein
MLFWFVGPFLARVAITREGAAKFLGSFADAVFRATKRCGDSHDRRALSRKFPDRFVVEGRPWLD